MTLSIMRLRIMRLSMMRLSMMRLSMMTFSIMTLSIMRLSIMRLSIMTLTTTKLIITVLDSVLLCLVLLMLSIIYAECCLCRLLLISPGFTKIHIFREKCKVIKYHCSPTCRKSSVEIIIEHYIYCILLSIVRIEYSVQLHFAILPEHFVYE